jgi:high-affinity nickel-transport protein
VTHEAWPVRPRTVVAGVAVLHLSGLALLTLSPQPALLGIGLTAYVLGVRHGLDADHLTAIDGAVRGLVTSRRHPVGAGFLFSLGHAATVAFGVALFAALDVAGVNDTVARAGAIVGGATLLVLGAINVPALVAGVRGRPVQRRSVLGHLGRHAASPRSLVAIGIVFGFSLDSAAAVLLLTQSSGGLAVALALPLLFGAGMSLVDTVDGELMRHICERVSETRVRANVATTAACVSLAFAIGGYELATGLA